MYQVDVVAENKEIVKRYRSLLRAWSSNKGIRDKNRVREAFELAKEAHSTMRRRSGEPYIYHPLEVARIVAENIGLGETAIICALLHDVIEDNADYSLDFIQKRFGDKVSYIVDGLTKIKDGYEKPESSIQAENIKKMLLTLSDDVRVILIKLADRLHNMRTLDSMPDYKKKNIAAETIYLYSPLAHRLGLYAIKSELEDLALKYTEPEIYNTIYQKLLETESARSRFIQKFIYPIKRDLARRGITFEIDSREKSIYSIYKKMQLKEIPFEEVFDIFAVRIIVDSPQELEKINCWQVYSIVTDHYNPKLNRLRDWISTPKANGYESLHTTVMSQTGQWVEVQIRTRRMHEIAERGYAAHWKYKQMAEKEKAQESGLDQWLRKVQEILRSPDSNTLNFLDDIKLTLFSDEVFVFTPKGEIKSLPVGSTIIDFAYNIHTHLGNTCIAAKVNRKLSPLNYKLKSGDQVEIIASKKGFPRDEWLDYAFTARAKTYIKEAIKEQRKSIANEGRVKLEGYFEELSLKFSKSNINRFAEHSGFISHSDLFYKVAMDEIGLIELRSCCIEHEYMLKENEPSSVPVNADYNTSSEKLKSPHTRQYEIQDLDNLEFTIAHCCHALPGDDIVGYAPNGSTLQVHRTNCPEAIELMSRYANRMVFAKWSNRNMNTFMAGIKATGIDRKSMIFDIIQVISEKLGLNIRSFHIETTGDIFEAHINLYVHDTIDMNKLSEELKHVNGISTANRIFKFVPSF
ncbi:MAG: bifunctional (p)ppGpp synthetase/guanosine-3',5'-bis(diphosphate) 3'-pyrophosphohydrolase [Bacteroidales bacterium]|nr:bifunctional (p)ppGpp synthetase/guanosine-3',5'-bis(diphosphate) 3'-pyrophosphohydrolase [Bacteroidales bacterium]